MERERCGEGDGYAAMTLMHVDESGSVYVHVETGIQDQCEPSLRPKARKCA